MSSLDEVKEIITRNDIKTVILMGTDPVGVQRGKRLAVPYFLKASKQGINFASYIMGTTTMDDVLPGLFDTGIPDVRGEPDLSTFRLAPWEPQTAVCLMNWTHPDGSPHPSCPRSELIRQVGLARKAGFEEFFSLELEFYLFPINIEKIRAGQWADISPAAKDIHCYSIYEGSFWEGIVSKICEYFEDSVEGCAPEWGPGQFEINLYRSSALQMADTAILFKSAVKQLAARAGLSATFMAKWHESHSGSSGHIHQSLREKGTSKPVFYDENHPTKMSPIFQSYTAGQFELFRPASLFLAPFVNSYKRFQRNSFAGSMQTWGIDNRTVTYRVINSSPEACRLENQFGGADLNPYLAFSTLLGSGLYGIENKLTLPPLGEGNCYEAADKVFAPRTLSEAADYAAESATLKKILSPALVDNVVRIARFEAEVHQTQVTDLERRRYFEMA